MSHAITDGVKVSAMTDRALWADIARGICIIFVVIGHADIDNWLMNLIYWFHMPAFFVISGFFFKPSGDRATLVSWIKKRTYRLIIPYLTLLLILTAIASMIGVFDQNLSHPVDAVDTILGGKNLTGLIGIKLLWFLPVLYLTQVAFALINFKLKTMRNCLIVVGAAYILAHIETWLMSNNSFSANVPLAADIVLLSLSFYAFGYYSKSYLARPSKKLFAITGGLTAILISLNLLGLFDYSFHMINSVYVNVVFDIIIPVMMTVFVIECSHMIGITRLRNAFSSLGKNALVVYYLHLLMIYCFLLAIPILLGMSLSVSPLLTVAAVAIGIAIPYIISIFILQRFKITRMLFLGEFERPKKKGSDS